MHARSSLSDSGLLSKLSLFGGREDREPGFRTSDVRAQQASICEELENLFNTLHLEHSRKLDAWPEVRKSTLNYGVPGVAGLHTKLADTVSLKAKLLRAIEYFEPRLKSGATDIEISINEQSSEQRHLTIWVSSEFQHAASDYRICVRVDLDPETGVVKDFTELQ